MSPRAACRLETLGFAEVYDYVGGKVEWLAAGLPVEGEAAGTTAVGDLARDDVVTVALDEPVDGLRERIESSPYGFALVVHESGCVLGRIRRSALDDAAGRTAADLMEGGPATVRPGTPPAELAERLDRRDLKTMVVTTAKGRLVGVVRRGDLPGG